jgi:transposase
VPIPRESQGPGVSGFPDFSLNFSPKIFENSPTIAPYYTYNVIMTENIDPIPDDLSACQELLRAVLVRLRDLERQLDEFVATTEELQRSYDCLKEEYLALRRLFFGPRRERLPEAPGQQHLFDTDVAPALADQPADPAPAAELPPRKPKKGHGRRPIPDHLPRTEVLHDVPPQARVCDCGRDKTRIGEDVTEQLDYQPGKLLVLKHIYPKYACSCCKDGVTSAEPVANPIERCLAAPGLLAYVLVNKFSDHLPLYRQQDVLARHGIFLSRSTLCGWMAQSARLLRPLVELMRQRVVQSDLINADETPVRVLDLTRDSTRTSQFWAYISQGNHGYTVYDYRDSRSRDGPAEFLKDFRGYLQTDAYSSYESVVLESAGRIIPVGCWAHARRNFFDARLNQPRETHYVLSLIGQLYDIEDQIRLLGPDQRRAVRQVQSVPVLDRLEAYLRQQKDGALPKSQYGQAIAYVLNHRDQLRRYTEDGRLEIDNNVSERTLRLCAIGRKNWLFLGSDQGGETAAICFTILANAKRYCIEPFEYVRALLIGLSSDQVELESLLPDVWIAAHPEHVLQYRRDEAEAAASARRKRRALRRSKTAELSSTP